MSQPAKTLLDGFYPGRVHHLHSETLEKGDLPLTEVDASGSTKTINDTPESTKRKPQLTESVNQGPRAQFPTFKLVEFNSRRHRRGAEGARVEVQWSERSVDSDWLWMSVENVRDNIRQFGPSAELSKALYAYELGRMPT